MKTIFSQSSRPAFAASAHKRWVQAKGAKKAKGFRLGF
jgi:hypothetical protein